MTLRGISICKTAAGQGPPPVILANVGGVVLQVELGDLLAGRPPHIRESFRIIDELSQGPNAERLSNDMRMKSDVHHAGAGRTLAVKLVELFFEDGEGALDVLALPSLTSDV